MSLALAMIQEDYGPYVAQSVEEELNIRLTKADQEELPPETSSPDNYPIDRFSELVAWVMRNLESRFIGPSVGATRLYVSESF